MTKTGASEGEVGQRAAMAPKRHPKKTPGKRKTKAAGKAIGLARRTGNRKVHNAQVDTAIAAGVPEALLPDKFAEPADIDLSIEPKVEDLNNRFLKKTQTSMAPLWVAAAVKKLQEEKIDAKTLDVIRNHVFGKPDQTHTMEVGDSMKELLDAMKQPVRVPVLNTGTLIDSEPLEVIDEA